LLLILTKMKALSRGKYLGQQTDSLVYDNIIISKTEYQQREDQHWHYHENSFFAYFLKGGNRESRKSTELTCCAGTLLFYQAHEIHRNQHYAFGSKIFHLEMDKSWFADNGLQAENIKHSEIKDVFAKNVFVNLIREFSIRDEFSEDSIQHLLLYVLNLLSRDGQTKKAVPAWVKRFREIEHTCIDCQPTLAKISKQLCIHPVTLSKDFPDYYHCSFADYIRQLHIEKSLPLLAKKNVPVSEVASLCGFSDTSNFIRSFKKVKAVTPSIYRQML
jgi:AraC family transcriptional regulator